MNRERDILHRLFLIVYHLKKKFHDFIEGYDITEMEAKIIFFIKNNNVQTSEIIERFEKHKSTIRQKTRSLEEKGYIDIIHSQKDKRERVLSLTEKGKKFQNQLKKIEKKYHDDVFKKFNQQEKKEFITLIEKIEIEHYENIC